MATPGGQTWRTKGTRLNPYRVGETGVALNKTGDAVFNVTLNGGNVDNESIVTPSGYAIRNNVRPAGTKFVTTNVTLKFLKRQGYHPASATWQEFVDPADKAFTLYAYRKGEIDCDNVGKVAGGIDLKKGVGITNGEMCAVVPAASATSSLLLRFQAKLANGRKPYEVWFAPFA